MKFSSIQWEYMAAAALLIVILTVLFPALLHARAEVRDDLRRQDIAGLKRALELYNNQYTHYGTLPEHAPACTRVNDPGSWMFGKDSPLLKEQFIDAIPHDVRESREHTYEYCVTNRDEKRIVQGFYLQAQLEVDQEDTRARDEDEDRKFHYRVLHECNKVLYRVCGGTENQCQPNGGE